MMKITALMLTLIISATAWADTPEFLVLSRAVRKNGGARKVSLGSTLTKDEQLRLTVRPTKPMHLYVFQSDKGRGWSKRYPRQAQPSQITAEVSVQPDEIVLSDARLEQQEFVFIGSNDPLNRQALIRILDELRPPVPLWKDPTGVDLVSKNLKETTTREGVDALLATGGKDGVTTACLIIKQGVER